ncbi:MAG: hypothetical protein ABS85_14905 [Sphingobacteriales bacterium SCN 48-20]|nr:MAG: hypothetical protein ABS85_14905 [Sphingobacteriales bacterium SCN 48-20]OJW43690.1 MAG: hypothetical protein BGO56_05130 [Sphingobacteriales bacterium 48-107]
MNEQVDFIFTSTTPKAWHIYTFSHYKKGRRPCGAPAWFALNGNSFIGQVFSGYGFQGYELKTSSLTIYVTG